MRSFAFILLLIPIILLIDLYAYKGIRKALSCNKKHLKSILFWIWWVFSFGMISGILVFVFRYEGGNSDPDFNSSVMRYNAVFVVQFAVKLFYILFEFVRDVIAVAEKIKRKFTKERSKGPISESRREFIRKAGILASVIPFVGLIHGIGWGRFNFTLHRKRVILSNLPESFNGLKVVQLSDAHLGSFNGRYDKIEEVVDRINDLKPDLIMFTGDMVNNFSHEMSGWVPVWKRLKATYGKFSVLGNHDYGNYSEWPNPMAKKKNLQEIIRQEKEMGFDVLLNEHRIIRNENNESIIVAGVENWGSPPFPQFGDLDKALGGTEKNQCTILLSHDPDHWSKKVLDDNRADLTLSGHTHGFQMGIEIGNFKISPVQLKYKHWAGLYENNSRFLYVNRGLGYLSFPGRVGIWPEITLLELYNK